MMYSELQEKGFALAKQLEALPLEERLALIARTFGYETANLEMSARGGDWSEYTAVSLVFDSSSFLGIGNYLTRQANTDEAINECVNNALARYHPDIVHEAKARAAAALLEREAVDNETAAKMGLRPYTFLNVEFVAKGYEQSDYYLGWYYATLAVDGKIFGLVTSGLSDDINRGAVSERDGPDQFYVAGGIRKSDVDFVFGGVGFSTASSRYQIDLSDDARNRAEQTLAKRMIPYRKPSLLGKLEGNKRKAAQAGNPDVPKHKASELDV